MHSGLPKPPVSKVMKSYINQSDYKKTCLTLRCENYFFLNICFKGRKHIPRSEVICQSCHHAASEMEIQSIIENGFWPGSTNRICQIYSTDLLKWIDCFLKNMPGSSLSSIAKAIEDFDGTVE